MVLTIRSIRTISEYHGCEAIQRQAWAIPNDDDLEVVPLHLLTTAHKNGGILLGAFEDDELVGFVFGFIGLSASGRMKHCSHMMGVIPGVQSGGVGYQLKLAQRESVLAQGLDLITWTYDPLESRNAYLNVAKLGAICRTYVRDLYGPMTDGLNVGLPPDRFEMEWWIGTERVRRRLAGEPPASREEPVAQANATSLTSAGFLAPGTLRLRVDTPRIRVEIPADYQAIKPADPELAREWRAATRLLFEHYFAVGYSVVDFYRDLSGPIPRSYYLLSLEMNRVPPV